MIISWEHHGIYEEDTSIYVYMEYTYDEQHMMFPLHYHILTLSWCSNNMTLGCIYCWLFYLMMSPLRGGITSTMTSGCRAGVGKMAVTVGF